MPNYLQHIYKTTTKRGKVVAVLDEPITTQDHDADAFIVTVSDAVFSGGNAYGDFVRADGVTIPLSGTISGDTATVILAPNCYTVPGRFFLTVKVEAAGSKTTYLQIEGYAKPSSTDEYAVAGDDSAPIDVILEAAEKAEQVLSAVADKAPAIPVDASGDMVHITDGAEGMPVQSLITHVEPKETGEGDKSPANPWTIIGWDEVSVTGAGKNLFPVRSLTFTGQKREYFASEMPPGTYTISAEVTSADTDQSTSRIAFMDSAGNAFAYVNFSRGARASQTVTVDRAFNSIRFYSSTTVSNSTGDEATWTDIMVEKSETASDFEPYNGKTLTAALPETLYGFDINWTTGLVTVTHIWNSFTGNEPFKLHSTGLGYYINYGNGIRSKTGICSHFHTNSYEELNQGNIGVYMESSSAVIFTTAFNTVEDWTNFLKEQNENGTPVQICYELETPYTIQLTPQQLSTLKGTNNIWSDAGATEVTYAADTKMYADGKDSTAMIGTAEPGMIATKNYASGDFIVVGKSMYKATAAIATGEAITPGTNCTATTVVEQLAVIYNLLNA